MHFIQRYSMIQDTLFWVQTGTFDCSIVPFAFRLTENAARNNTETLCCPKHHTSFASIYQNFKKIKKIKKIKKNKATQRLACCNSTRWLIKQQIQGKKKKKTVPTWTTESSIAGMRLRFHPTQTHTQHWTTHLL